MADFYMVTGGGVLTIGSDAQNGTTWALAKLTLEGAYAVMSAGDRLWVQGVNDDTAAATRTFTSPGIITNPCILTGVVDGTTNEPPVLADLAVTLPKIACTGAASDINIAGFATWIALYVSSADRFTLGTNLTMKMVNSKLASTDDVGISGSGNSFLILENTIYEILGASGRLSQGDAHMMGGSILFTATASVIDNAATGHGLKTFTGVDISGLGTTTFVNQAGGSNIIKIRNCILPAVFNKYSSSPTLGSTMEVIASSDTTSVGVTSSIQDYEYEDVHGTIDAEFTAVRTGGADDGASGAFAYAMTPSASSTLESSQAILKSPWLGPIWVEAGSQTAKVHIANDGGVDYNEDEMWTEFYTVDVGDTAQHNQTFNPANTRLFASSTAITDDAVSSWGGTAANGQEMSTGALVYGFEGPIYARVSLAKRQVTPDTVFVDGLIEVT